MLGLMMQTVDTLILVVFLKECENINSEKKILKNFPACKELKDYHMMSRLRVK